MRNPVKTAAHLVNLPLQEVVKVVREIQAEVFEESRNAVEERIKDLEASKKPVPFELIGLSDFFKIEVEKLSSENSK